MTLILPNVIQNMILNNIQEVSICRSDILGNANASTVTFKLYNSHLMKMNLIIVFWEVLEINYKNM